MVLLRMLLQLLPRALALLALAHRRSRFSLLAHQRPLAFRAPAWSVGGGGIDRTGQGAAVVGLVCRCHLAVVLGELVAERLEGGGDGRGAALVDGGVA